MSDRSVSFARLHERGNPLVLPNAWDAASARIFEAAGFPALGTSSAGMAYALGYPDGERMNVDEMIAAIARITRTVRIYVTADVEAGYAADAGALVAIMERVKSAGAIGVNLEDWNVGAGGPFALDVAQARIAAVKSHFGEALFINARSDLYLQNVGDPGTRFEATVERLRSFIGAGADGVFVPGVSDPATIRALVDAARPTPLNVLASPAMPAVGELRALGVGRVSVGPGPMRRVLGETRAIARELREHGTFSFLQDERAIPYAELNTLFERR